MNPPIDAASLHRDHKAFLWGLSYRMTGCAADADDIVQDTFLRAMERPPARRDESWRPWLVRVAMNLGRDTLRRRKRTGYVGPWLPSPIETEGEPPSWEIAGDGGTAGRYDLLESVSFAFLLALEALTPQQRAVLLLRDVCDYSVEETAAALGMSQPNVKTTHHRARRALLPYDGARCQPSPALVERSREALSRFLKTLSSGDSAAVEALLSEDVRGMTDGGGEFFAARVPLIGPARVAQFCLGVRKHQPPRMRHEIRILNGLPALVVEASPAREKIAPRYIFRCDIDEAGRIIAVHSILATRKLSALRPLAA